MIRDIQHVKQDEVLTVVHPTVISKYQMKAELGKHLPKIYQLIVQNGRKATTMPFTLYRRIEDETIDVEMGIAVDGKLDLPKKYCLSKLPKTKIVKGKFFGPYSKLNEGYDNLEKWALNNNLKPRYPYWEIYVSDPMDVEDLSELRTDLHIVVQDGK